MNLQYQSSPPEPPPLWQCAHCERVYNWITEQVPQRLPECCDGTICETCAKAGR